MAAERHTLQLRRVRVRQPVDGGADVRLDLGLGLRGGAAVPVVEDAGHAGRRDGVDAREVGDVVGGVCPGVDVSGAAGRPVFLTRPL